MMFNDDVIDRIKPTPLVVGIFISLLNILLCVGFFATCVLSTYVATFAREEWEMFVPVIPLVVLAFGLLSPVAWLAAGRWIALQGRPRLIAAALGQVPLVCGVGLAFLLGVVNVIWGGSPAGVLMPILAAGIAFVAGGISVLCIYFAHSNRPSAEESAKG